MKLVNSQHQSTISTVTQDLLTQVRTDLKNGLLPIAPARFSIDKLAKQLQRLQSVARAQKEKFSEFNVDIDVEISRAESLLVLVGEYHAAENDANDEWRAHAAEMAAAETGLMAVRAAAQKIADARSIVFDGLDITFDRGKNTIESGQSLVEVLRRHGTKLGNPKFAERLVVSAETHLDALVRSGTAYHAAKLRAETSTTEKANARGALFAALRTIADFGFVAFFDEPKVRGLFQLDICYRKRSRKQYLDTEGEGPAVSGDEMSITQSEKQTATPAVGEFASAA